MPKQQILDLDKSERIILEIKRHPIGIFGYYAFAVVAIATLLGVLFLLVAQGDSLEIDLPQSLYVGIFSFLIGLFALFTWIGVYIYRQNELVITNENLIQILQFGLFNKQVSQLNLAKIQDVSVDQVGIVQTFFKYGTVSVETAGEAANFNFKYTADPHRVAKIIIEAHEDFIREHHGSTRRI